MSSVQLMTMVQQGELLDAISLLTVKHQYQPIVVHQLERMEKRVNQDPSSFNYVKSGLMMLIKYADRPESEIE